MMGQWTCLTFLDLGSNAIGADGARSLARALGQCPSLSKLDLRENRIQSQGARSLARVLEQGCSLTSLNLYYNDIDEHDVKFLRGLQGPSSFWHRLDIQGIGGGEGD
jgi:Ran GTPase-activating protein (RanGAP) involved in mRNA processing and transport